MTPPRQRPPRSERLRTLAELGRHVVRRTILEDPDLREQLDRIGILNPEIKTDPEADPLKAPTPRLALARAITAIASRDRTYLGSSGVGGLEALAAVLEAEGEGESLSEDICIGFTDIVNFTAYTDARGDEAALDMLQRQEAITVPILRSRGGSVVKTLGDGLMMRFPTPHAGVSGILDLFDRLDTEVVDDEDRIQMRAGLTIGRPLEVGSDLVGGDVNLAARVTAAARAHQLLVTESIVGACAGDLPDIAFRSRGRRRLKGFDEKVPLWEATRIEAGP